MTFGTDPYNDPDDPLVQLGQAEAEAEAAAAGTEPAPEGEPGGEGEPAGEPAAGQEPPAGEPAGQEPEPRVFAGRFQSAEELERGYTELERRFGQQGNELGQELRQMREQLAAMQQQQPAPQPAQGGEQELTREQLAQWMEEDPVEATLYIASLAGTAAVQPFAEQVARQIEPLTQGEGRRVADRAVDALRTNLGADMFARNRDVIAQQIAADKAAGIAYPDENAAFQRMRQVVIAAEYDRGALAAPGQGLAPQPGTAPAAGGQVVTRRAVAATEGGSTPQPSEPGGEQDPLLASMSRPVEERGVFGRRRRADLFVQQ